MILAELEPFSAYLWQGQQVDYLEPQGAHALIVLPDGSEQAVDPAELSPLE